MPNEHMSSVSRSLQPGGEGGRGSDGRGVFGSFAAGFDAGYPVGSGSVLGEHGDRRSSKSVMSDVATAGTLGESGDRRSSELVGSAVAIAATIGERALSASVSNPNPRLSHTGICEG